MSSWLNQEIFSTLLSISHSQVLNVATPVNATKTTTIGYISTISNTTISNNYNNINVWLSQEIK